MRRATSTSGRRLAQKSRAGGQGSCGARPSAGARTGPGHLCHARAAGATGPPIQRRLSTGMTAMLRAIPCTLMRGGTSKGLYFHRRDLPADPATRDRVLLAAMGSPDVRQIDGVGGAHPLTSKVAVIGPATRPDADVDYLF